MQKPISLGALIKSTEEYVYPKLAVKGGSYICPECRHDLILCKGTKVSPYFRHRSEQRPCNHYTNPGESQIHKDAKLMLKTALEKKVKITIRRKCPSCKTTDEYEIPEVSDTSCVEVEHRFDYNGLKIADVAYLDNNEPVCMFEIYNTHATSTDKRPEPWFEFDAKALILAINSSDSSTVVLNDLRTDGCDDMICAYRHDPVELLVRRTLGQTIVNPICENYPRVATDERFRVEGGFITGDQDHFKFHFDARDDVWDENKTIIDKFNGTRQKDGIFTGYRVVIHSWKGSIHAFIVSKNDYYNYNYWDNCYTDRGKIEYPIVEYRHYYGEGTVRIIKDLVLHIKMLHQAKINKLLQINSEMRRLAERISRDDSDYQNSNDNETDRLKTEQLLVEHDILYDKNSYYALISRDGSPDTVQLALKSRKIKYQKKWYDISDKHKIPLLLRMWVKTGNNVFAL